MDIKSKFASLGGIIPAIQDRYVPLTEPEIVELESWIGSLIPADYKSFVSEFGRSSFNEYIDFRPSTPFVTSSSDWGHLALFFGGKSPTHETATLLWNYKTYYGRIPKHLLPIATDGGGDLICIAVGGPRSGQIYYWDHTHEGIDEILETPSSERDLNEFLNVTLVANSFNDFIERLEISTRA